MHEVFFITLYVGYAHFSVGFFNDNKLIDHIIEQKIKASSLIILYIQRILERNSISIDALTFIGVCNGPGSFTSLRISVVTANGLAYACCMPLVAINSFDALQVSTLHTNTLLLYNAYGGDFYYRIVANNISHDGCTTLNDLKNIISQLLPIKTSIYCIGHGTSIALAYLKEHLPSYAFIELDAIQEPTLQALGSVAYKNYNKGLVNADVEPLYLKKGYNL